MFFGQLGELVKKRHDEERHNDHQYDADRDDKDTNVEHEMVSCLDDDPEEGSGERAEKSEEQKELFELVFEEELQRALVEAVALFDVKSAVELPRCAPNFAVQNVRS